MNSQVSKYIVRIALNMCMHIYVGGGEYIHMCMCVHVYIIPNSTDWESNGHPASRPWLVNIPCERRSSTLERLIVVLRQGK